MRDRHRLLPQKLVLLLYMDLNIYESKKIDLELCSLLLSIGSQIQSHKAEDARNELCNRSTVLKHGYIQ